MSIKSYNFPIIKKGISTIKLILSNFKILSLIVFEFFPESNDILS